MFASVTSSLHTIKACAAGSSPLSLSQPASDYLLLKMARLFAGNYILNLSKTTCCSSFLLSSLLSDFLMLESRETHLHIAMCWKSYLSVQGKEGRRRKSILHMA